VERAGALICAGGVQLPYNGKALAPRPLGVEISVFAARGGVSVSSSLPLNRPQLLLVENDRGVRDAIQDYLEDEGYSVLSANDGEQALSILEGLSDPCLVVLDVRTPVMDGVEFMRQFRARPWLKHHRMVLMSATELAPEICGAPGVVGLLQKPFELERLLSLVQAEVVLLPPPPTAG
jgi:CheY-like chemotaxis protein